MHEQHIPPGKGRQLLMTHCYEAPHTQQNETTNFRTSRSSGRMSTRPGKGLETMECT